MVTLKKLFFLSFLMPFLLLGCSLEQICENEGVIECLEDGNGSLGYRVCHNGAWVNENCRESETCLENACVALSELCEENTTRCLGLKSVERCTKFNRAKLDKCGEGFYCDATACAAGEACCVAGEVCHETQNTCLDKDTLKVCVVDERPSEQACKEGMKCDAGACVIDEVLDCDSTYIASCANNVALTCVGDRIVKRDCGDKICKGGECVDAVCHNGRLDTGEVAVDCGGACEPCGVCWIDADCGVDGFCDSVFGYLCSKRCVEDADCSNSGFGMAIIVEAMVDAHLRFLKRHGKCRRMT